MNILETLRQSESILSTELREWRKLGHCEHSNIANIAFVSLETTIALIDSWRNQINRESTLKGDKNEQ